MNNIEEYIITKKTSRGERIGIDWEGLVGLREKLWPDNMKEFDEFYGEILTKAKQKGILVFPQPRTFYAIVEEVNPYPNIKGERHNFRDSAELYDYINAFWKGRWITPVMQLKL